MEINAQVTDVNGKTYKTTTIGTQIWMSENLDVDRFQNGDIIPQAKTEEEWEKASKKNKPAWCYNNNDPINGYKYGKLYNWYAVKDSRGLAPVGFHLPSSIEWSILVETLGGPENCAMAIRSKSGWVDRAPGSNNDYNGTNESGFNALPGGYRRFPAGGNQCYWWTSTEDNSDNAWFVTFDFMIRMYHSGVQIHYEELNIQRNGKKNEGYSIRCIKT